MIPVIGVWVCIQVFRWLMRRYTGEEVQITPNRYFNMYRDIKTVWHHDPLNYDVAGKRKARKPKQNPHFERLMEQEEMARLDGARQRIRDVDEATVQDEPVPLASLLQQDE